MNVDSRIIQTKFLSGQGLGNQLWVYAAARAIAEKNERQHVVLGMDDFKGHKFLDIDSAIDPVPHYPIDQFNEMQYYDPSLKYFSSLYDRRVESLPSRVQLNGLFQSEKYFYGYMPFLSSWIRPNKYVQEKAADFSDVCVLNLRGGEYKRHRSFILPRSYWDNAVKALRQKLGDVEIIVVTDDPAYARVFLPEFPTLKGGIAECYAALMGARAIIVSNSSFSYFPIKSRNDAPFVIAPEFWARYGHPDSRWAMPVNVYKDWNYLSADGAILNYADCLQAAESDAKYYEATFNIRIPMNTGIGISLTRFIPTYLKRPLKRIAAYLFPNQFG
jgi:hypothetical protein